MIIGGDDGDLVGTCAANRGHEGQNERRWNNNSKKKQQEKKGPGQTDEEKGWNACGEGEYAGVEKESGGGGAGEAKK